jgi:hypothetical protein
MNPDHREDHLTAESYASLIHDDIKHYDNAMRAHLARLEQIRLLIFSAATLGVPPLLLRGEYWVGLFLPFIVYAVYLVGLHFMVS